STSVHPECSAPRPLTPCPTRRSSDLTRLRARRDAATNTHGEDLRRAERRRRPQRGTAPPRILIPNPFLFGTLHSGEFMISTRRRSEEHTSELQSHLNLVCRLLLEKKH